MFIKYWIITIIAILEYAKYTEKNIIAVICKNWQPGYVELSVIIEWLINHHPVVYDWMTLNDKNLCFIKYFSYLVFFSIFQQILSFIVTQKLLGIYISISIYLSILFMHEHRVADMFWSKKSSLALLAHEQQQPQKWCLSSRYSTACGDYKRNIYENKSSVCKTSKCWKMTHKMSLTFNSVVVCTS